MKKKKLKKQAIYSLYGISFVLLIGAIYLVDSISLKKEEDINYVTRTILDDEVPVIGDIEKIIKPYLDENVKLAKKFYDSNDTEDNQQESIIKYGNTYLQSSGVCYSSENKFDIVSIYGGTVIAVDEDEMLGKTVEIRHSNDVISIYQSLSDVNVKVDDVVQTGTVIGKSGTSNINKDLGNHLYFELLLHGSLVNPEIYYGKSLSEL